MMSNFEKFGKYILLEKLAAGGMAEVYLAKSAGINGVNKFFAIKRILPQFSTNQDFIEMFQTEAKVSVNLNNSNVVSIYEFGMEKGQFYIVMEFVEGRNLRQIINELKKFNRSIKIEEAVYLIKEAAAGLDHAHRCVDQQTGKPLNITHRDMSPQNVMVSFEGEVKVIDFGIAKKTEGDGEATKAGTLKGKFAYMSPEQAEGEEVDPRTDIFALGIILWELLANDRLFSGSNENAILRKVRECNIQSIRKINPLVPAELDRIVSKALAKDRNVRYQTAANMQKDLNRFLNTQYPDFSPSDFSKNIIECFKNSYQEGRDKLVAYAKIEVADVVAAENNHVEKLATAVTPPPVAKIDQQVKQPIKPQTGKPADEHPAGFSQNDNAVKIDLHGIKDAYLKDGKTNISKPRPATNPTSNSKFNSETNVGYNTKITHVSQVSRQSANGQFSDVFLKIFILVIMSLGGYFGYSKFINPTPSKTIAQKSKLKNTEGQVDLAATASVKLSISSQPSGAQILIDGVDSGRTTPAIVSITANKDTTITLKKDSYYVYEVKKNISETSVLTTTLQQMPRAAYLNINVQNGGAKPVIYINGQRLSEQPPIKRYAVTADAPVKIMAVNPITNLADETTVTAEENKETNVDLILGRKK